MSSTTAVHPSSSAAAAPGAAWDTRRRTLPTPSNRTLPPIANSNWTLDKLSWTKQIDITTKALDNIGDKLKKAVTEIGTEIKLLREEISKITEKCNEQINEKIEAMKEEHNEKIKTDLATVKEECTIKNNTKNDQMQKEIDHLVSKTNWLDTKLSHKVDYSIAMEKIKEAINESEKSTYKYVTQITENIIRATGIDRIQIFAEN
ncbi:hypothetical protein HC928_14480 [bacterium]|nr:hypothetical protein [bacterium]